MTLEVVLQLNKQGYGLIKRLPHNRRGKLSRTKLLMVVPLAQLRPFSINRV